MDIAGFVLDIAGFETTMAFSQVLVHFKVFIQLGFNEMALTELSVEKNSNK